MSKGDFFAFRKALYERESNGNYKTENSLGYLGAAQFGKPRLWDLGLSIDGWKPKDVNNIPSGIKIITKEMFLSNSDLQDDIFKAHVIAYKIYALRRLSKYIGIKVNDINITLSGLIAGAHLMGWGNDKNPGVIQFLRNGIDNKDGYGTHISEYISKFADYDLSNIT